MIFFFGIDSKYNSQKVNYRKLSHGLIAVFVVISFHGKVSSIFAYGHLRQVPWLS